MCIYVAKTFLCRCKLALCKCIFFKNILNVNTQRCFPFFFSFSFHVPHKMLFSFSTTQLRQQCRSSRRENNTLGNRCTPAPLGVKQFEPDSIEHWRRERDGAMQRRAHVKLCSIEKDQSAPSPADAKTIPKRRGVVRPSCKALLGQTENM